MIVASLCVLVQVPLSSPDTTADASDATGDVRTVRIAYESQAEEFTLGEPVLIDVVIENLEEETVHTELGDYNRSPFEVTVTAPDGTLGSPIVLERRGLSEIRRVAIGPGERHSESLLLNVWTPFPEVGEYLVRIRFRYPVETESGMRVDVPAETVRVRIGARDEQRLRALCEELLSVIAQEGSTAIRVNDVRLLSHVTDPVAVAYIEEALAITDWFDFLLFDGLVRIGTDDAREVLAAMAAETGERAELAAVKLEVLARKEEGIPPPTALD